MKKLSLGERNFAVCDDCIWFCATEEIGEPGSAAKRGKCIKHNKQVENHWETDCEDHSCNFCCKDCVYLSYVDPENVPGSRMQHCARWGSNPSGRDAICAEFKKKEILL